MNHRGRFQAQGDSLEESEPWAQDLALLHKDGAILLSSLEQKVPHGDRVFRKVGFKKCRECIDKASKNNGINVNDMGKPFIKSFPKNYKERVDLEVRKGIAFILKYEEEENDK